MDDSVFEVRPLSAKPEKKQIPYRWRSCFASEEEYAQYLSDVITPGMTVRCCKAVEPVSFFLNYIVCLYHLIGGKASVPSIALSSALRLKYNAMVSLFVVIR